MFIAERTLEKSKKIGFIKNPANRRRIDGGHCVWVKGSREANYPRLSKFRGTVPSHNCPNQGCHVTFILYICMIWCLNINLTNTSCTCTIYKHDVDILAMSLHYCNLVITGLNNCCHFEPTFYVLLKYWDTPTSCITLTRRQLPLQLKSWNNSWVTVVMKLLLLDYCSTELILAILHSSGETSCCIKVMLKWPLFSYCNDAEIAHPGLL